MSIPESGVEAILSNILGEEYEVKLGKSRVEDLLIGLAGLIAKCAQLDEVAALAARVTALETRATNIETVNTAQNVAIDERLSGWAGDRASYDALATKDKELYFIEED